MKLDYLSGIFLAIISIIPYIMLKRTNEEWLSYLRSDRHTQETALAEMNTNRNSLFKLMHDTRLRIKRRLAQEGLTPADVMEFFEKG